MATVPDGIPYQQAALVRQALNQLENAEAAGQSTLADDARKRLDALGYKPNGKHATEAGASPQGRQARPRQTTAKSG